MFDRLKTSLGIEFLPQRQPAPLYAEMAGSLYVGAKSLIGGAVLGSVVVTRAAYVCDAPLLTALAALTVTAALGRILLYVAYHRAGGATREGYALKPWEYAYAFGAGLFSILVGLCGMLTLHHTHDTWTIVMMATFVMGYSCGIAARNSLRPWISSMQMWLSILPILWMGLGFDLSAAIFILGTLILFVSLRRDVSMPSYLHFLENYRVRQAKKEVDHQFDLALRNMSHGLALFDPNGALVLANERMAQILGIGPRAIVPGITPVEVLAACEAAGTLSGESCAALSPRVALGVTGTTRQAFEIALADERAVEISFSPIAAGGSEAGGGTVVVLEDITERKRIAARIEHLARFDALTGLPNRFSFRDRLNEALEGTDTFAVFAIDLDKFKAVNDTLGHSVGDKLLCSVAGRLRAMTGPQDMVSRFGGDEFVVILGSIGSPDDAAIFARRVVQNLSRPYQIEQHQLIIGASAGIAIGREHASDADLLLQYADMALYRVKEEARGNYKFFEPEMEEAAQKKRGIELDLRHAIARNELRVHFQPQFNLRHSRYTGCEALIRWVHPTRGFVSPKDFVAVAEETGMIVEIGEWVLRQSCLAAKDWPDEMRVAVNLSAVQFHAGNLVQTVRKALSETGLPAHRLELEITESLLMKDAERNGAIMRELKEMGVRISLDDFGTGYSSLSYLQKYPFNKVKVDKSFVDEIGKNRNAEAIIRAVGSLGNDMAMSITAEGVENAEQVRVVGDLGCTEIQGWFYSRDLPQQALLDFLAKPRELAA